MKISDNDDDLEEMEGMLTLIKTSKNTPKKSAVSS